MPPDRVLIVALAAVAGLLIGSFLNVCIYRLPRDLSVIHPRSFCGTCGTTLAWHHNIPLVSFLVLGQRCRYCSAAIGWQYPLVEAFTSFVFGFLVLRYGPSVEAAKWIVFACLLIVLFWTDLQARLLPDECTLGGLLAGLVFAAITAGKEGLSVFDGLLMSALGALILAVPLWLFGMLYLKVRKRQGLGLGDVKLVAMMGSFLGWTKGLHALMLGSIAGSVVGVIYIAVARKEAATYQLPFGSFLCLGALFVMLFEPGM